MSKLIPWARFIKRKQIDASKLLSRFETYEEFSRWFIQMGGNPPPLESVSQYFVVSDNLPISSKLKSPMPTDIPRVTVGMKNTKVQLIEIAAAHNVVVSYYDTKAKILRKMKRSGKFTIASNKKK